MAVNHLVGGSNPSLGAINKKGDPERGPLSYIFSVVAFTSAPGPQPPYLLKKVFYLLLALQVVVGL